LSGPPDSRPTLTRPVGVLRFIIDKALSAVTTPPSLESENLLPLLRYCTFVMERDEQKCSVSVSEEEVVSY